MGRALIVLIVLATVACEVVALVLTFESRVVTGAYAVYAVTQVLAGALILWRHPRHVIGWLLALFALVNALFADAALAYGHRAATTGWPFGHYAELSGLITWIFANAGLVGLFLLFPDGRLPAPRWRVVVAVWVVGAALAVPGWALNPRLGSGFAGGVNPFALPGVPADLLFGVGAILVSGSLVLSVTSLLLRFRRSQGRERRQLYWMVLAAGVLAVVLPVSVALWLVWPPIQVVAALAFPLLPIAACVALLRHHLYDVELVASRTLSWALLTLLLTGSYVALVLTAGLVVSSPVAAALAALLVAVSFQPLRGRLQSAIDRRFRRRRFEVRQQISDFVDAVRRGARPADDLEAVLRDAVGDPDLTLTFGPAPIPPAGRVCSRVGDVVLTHREEDGPVVVEAAEAARLAIEIATLQHELRNRIAEAEASRGRVVAAADEERRRIARDLHDGAQQRLVSIGLGLRHIEHRLGGRAPADVVGDLDAAVGEITSTITELRALAGGLRPAALDRGLTPALHELAARTPIPTSVDAPIGRLAADLESAAWFIACEGVTNAVKHARASAVAIDVHHENGSLVVAVRDDGRGDAVIGRGSGLLGLSDRITARGGTLTVTSPAGAGTRLEARLPCG